MPSDRKDRLRTDYLGLELANPLVASSSPMTDSVDGVKALADAGIGAVVLPSVFEEQITRSESQLAAVLEHGAEGFAEIPGGFLPDLVDYNLGADAHLALLEAAVDEVDIPVIASLNGVSDGGWTGHARRLEAAGAAAIELNVYLLTTDPTIDGREVERRYLDLVGSVVESVSVPVAVKLGPYFSSLPWMAKELARTGAAGLVLFNRFYQPGIDLESMTVTSDIELSRPSELRLPLRWTAVLRDVVDISLAATTGVHSADDVVRVLLAGADVAMLASGLLRLGPPLVPDVLKGVSRWLDDHGYDSVAQLRGSMSLASVPDPDRWVRANYVKMLTSYESPFAAGGLPRG